MSNETVVRYLERHSVDLGRQVAERMKEQRPELFRRYRRRLRNKEKTPEEWCAEDSAHHLRSLAAALAIEDPSEFENYRSWLLELLVARGISEEDVGLNFTAIAEVLQERLGEEADAALSMLRSCAG